MILGVGIDIVHISRMKQWRGKTGLLERYFHPEELADAQKKGVRGVDHSLAARFAAKEAFGKALGTGLAGLKLRDIQIVNDVQGKPSIELYATARRRFEALGGSALFVSLTHESDNAIAVVVIEGN